MIKGKTNIIQMVLDDSWTDLTEIVEKEAAIKLKNLVDAKSDDIRHKLNLGFDVV